MEDLFTALRRGRRCSTSMNVRSEEPQAPSAAPRTPRRRKRGARHSDPGSAVYSSSLTPMVRRTSLTAPNRRSATAPTSGAGSAPRLNGQPAAVNLHQTIDGRVERRMRRNGLRDMLNKIDQEKRRGEQLAKAQITKLKAELRARDREIYRMQNATMIFDTERIWELEQQVKELKGQLATKSIASEEATQYYSCVWPSTPSVASTDDLMDMAQDEDQFDDMAAQTNTPSRARPPFLTPPATSPTRPVSPFSKDVSPTADAHTEMRLNSPDADKKQLEDEIASLEFEIQKLTATLDSYNALGARISDALSGGTLREKGTSSSLEAIENQVQLLLQTMSERAAAVAHLTNAISELGFAGTDASEMIMSLASEFRSARLELEYLAPGEPTLPVTAHGADILDLLLDRLRTLSRKTREDEDSIDEYHEIERSLRKQLDSRISVMEELNIKLTETYRALDEKDSHIRELEIGNNRLKGAVDGYVRDITELEGLIERMETEHRESINAHAAQQKSSEELLTAKNTTIAELEVKIEEAVAQTAELLNEMSSTEANFARQTITIRKQHGAALAVRDTRVAELRDEIDRVTESLRVARETIHALRAENSGMRGMMEEERRKAKDAMDSMKEELQRVLYLSQRFLEDSHGASASGRAATIQGESDDSRTIVCNPSQMGTRRSKRRYDSGLELLNEDEVDI
ncbi:hypothetical protein LI328DRAFT_165345 [Trichoderma asperelloides]|nr:hypothetical protein LI328DRAFT_165345 [Trichoderma asperelloides]